MCVCVCVNKLMPSYNVRADDRILSDRVDIEEISTAHSVEADQRSN